jgi:hypothetical protein
MGIYDAMKLCKADVSTVCLGLAASMGAFILASGTKGKRFCMPNARVMIHQPLGTAGGKVSAWSEFCGYWFMKDNNLISFMPSFFFFFWGGVSVGIKGDKKGRNGNNSFIGRQFWGERHPQFGLPFNPSKSA